MFLYVSAVSLFLRFLTASAKGGLLAGLAHVDAISKQLERAASVVNLKEFESPVSSPTPLSLPVSAPTTSAPTRIASTTSAPTTIAPTTRAPATSTALTGYGFFPEYLDSKCTTLSSAELYPLNSCITFISDGKVVDVKVTATSSTYTIQTYTDSTCTTAVGTTVPFPYTSECSSNQTMFIVQSSNEISTTKATAYLR
jgi:hypothetical protein